MTRKLTLGQTGFIICAAGAAGLEVLAPAISFGVIVVGLMVILAGACRPTKPVPPRIDMAQYLTDDDRAELRRLGWEDNRPRRAALPQPASALTAARRLVVRCTHCNGRSEWDAKKNEYRCTRCRHHFAEPRIVRGRR